MRMGRLEIIDPGMFTTIQDEGRFGFRRYGIPDSGAMDGKAYDEANRLTGTKRGHPVIEFTLNGGTVVFKTDAIIALTGADMSPLLNDEPITMYASHQITEGDILKLGYAIRGCRSYLSMKGLLHSENVFGSYSTFEKAGIGGYKGRKLKTGDVLSWSEEHSKFGENRTPPKDIPYYSSKVNLHLIKGPEWDWFSENEREEMFKKEFRVSSNSDRMGIRLVGTGIKVPDRQLISSPVIPGIIQVPGKGDPIILMNDGQTIGGYPRIAKVPDSELWRLGQVKPGDTIRFVPSDPM